MKAKLNVAYGAIPAGTVINTIGLINNPDLLGKCTILSLSDLPSTMQGRKGAVVTTLANAVFTAPDGNPFCLCNETTDDSTVVLSVIFADDATNTAVSKRFKSGDNAYVLKSFTMPSPAVTLFYLQ